MHLSLILILIFISAIYIQIMKDFITVTDGRTDDTPTNRDASHLKSSVHDGDAFYLKKRY